MNYVALFLLRETGGCEEWAYNLLTALAEEVVPDYWSPSMISIQADMRVLNALVKRSLPQLHAHFEEIRLPLALFATQWLVSLFSYSLPPPTTCRIYDWLMLDGPPVLLSVTLALLRRAEPDLVATDDLQSCAELLQNQAASAFDGDALVFAAQHEMLSLELANVQVRKLRTAEIAKVRGKVERRENTKRMKRRYVQLLVQLVEGNKPETAPHPARVTSAPNLAAMHMHSGPLNQRIASEEARSSPPSGQSAVLTSHAFLGSNLQSVVSDLTDLGDLIFFDALADGGSPSISPAPTPPLPDTPPSAEKEEGDEESKDKNELEQQHEAFFTPRSGPQEQDRADGGSHSPPLLSLDGGEGPASGSEAHVDSHHDDPAQPRHGGGQHGGRRQRGKSTPRSLSPAGSERVSDLLLGLHHSFLQIKYPPKGGEIFSSGGDRSPRLTFDEFTGLLRPLVELYDGDAASSGRRRRQSGLRSAKQIGESVFRAFKDKQARLDWTEFMHCWVMLSGCSVEQKASLCFQVMDRERTGSIQRTSMAVFLSFVYDLFSLKDLSTCSVGGLMDILFPLAEEEDAPIITDLSLPRLLEVLASHRQLKEFFYLFSHPAMSTDLPPFVPPASDPEVPAQPVIRVPVAQRVTPATRRGETPVVAPAPPPPLTMDSPLLSGGTGQQPGTAAAEAPVAEHLTQAPRTSSPSSPLPPPPHPVGAAEAKPTRRRGAGSLPPGDDPWSKAASLQPTPSSPAQKRSTAYGFVTAVP